MTDDDGRLRETTEKDLSTKELSRMELKTDLHNPIGQEFGLQASEVVFRVYKSPLPPVPHTKPPPPSLSVRFACQNPCTCLCALPASPERFAGQECLPSRRSFSHKAYPSVHPSTLLYCGVQFGCRRPRSFCLGWTSFPPLFTVLSGRGAGRGSKTKRLGLGTKLATVAERGDDERYLTLLRTTVSQTVTEPRYGTQTALAARGIKNKVVCIAHT